MGDVNQEQLLSWNPTPSCRGRRAGRAASDHGQQHTRTCDKRSSPHTPSLQHQPAWPETRWEVQRSGHKVQETISGQRESIPWSSVSRTTKQANSSITHREKALSSLRSTRLLPPAATTESSKRSGWAGFLQQVLENYRSHSCKITTPAAGSTRIQPNLWLDLIPKESPLFKIFLHHLVAFSTV